MLHFLNKKGEGESHNQDVQSMIRAIHIIQKMNEISKQEEILDKDEIQKITNLAHYPDKKVQDAIGSFLISISEEFEDGEAALLELQKLKIEQSNESKYIGGAHH